MGLIALADDREDFGSITGSGAFVGEITLGATVAVLATGVALGIFGALLYVALRAWLPARAGSAIQWLLLARASSAAGADGDRLTGTTHIQRINTVGGLPRPRPSPRRRATRSRCPTRRTTCSWKATG